MDPATIIGLISALEPLVSQAVGLAVSARNAATATEADKAALDAQLAQLRASNVSAFALHDAALAAAAKA